MKKSQSVKDIFLSFVNGKQKEKHSDAEEQGNENLFTRNKINDRQSKISKEEARKRSNYSSSTLPRRLPNEEKKSFTLKEFSKPEKHHVLQRSYATMPRPKLKQNSKSLTDSLGSKISSFKKKQSNHRKQEQHHNNTDRFQNASSCPKETRKLRSPDYLTTSSDKLKVCLEKLEEMSLHLNYATDVSSKLEEFQATADLLLSTRNSNSESVAPPKLSSKQRFFGRRKKRKQSVETSSNDSGSSSDCYKLEEALLSLANPVSNLPQAVESQNYNSSDNSSVAQQSTSSGYHSENSSLYNPSYPSLYYPYPLSPFGPYDPSYHQSGYSPTQDNYNEVQYEPENSFYYSDSAASHEKYFHDGGWIYLPFTSNEEPFYHCNIFQNQYPASLDEQTGTYTENFTNAPQWSGSREAENFSKNPDIKGFGSFRYRNGEKTVIGCQSGRLPVGGKRVRFSKTVKKGKECDANVKKEVSEGESSPEKCDQEDASFQIPTEESRTHLGLSQQPIYEFPSGHIEKSCMCSDCILARQSSHLKPAENFAYY